ncbi:MAG: hypothetical protein ABJC09_00070 [Terriglobia bacterium]
MKSKLGVLAVGALVLAACGGLPRSVRNEIASENEKLDSAAKQIDRYEKNVKEEFVAGAATSPEWPARFREARLKLSNARTAAGELARLERRGDKESVLRAQRLLGDQRRERMAAVEEAEGVEASANRWLDFEKNPAHAAAQMQSDYDAIHSFDLSPVEKVVARAEQDWPSKKSDLDRRLGSLRDIKQKAETQFDTKAPIATLIANEEALSTEAMVLPREASELTAMSGQLYNSWDKILEDLDVTNGVYREKLKTVRTHFVDVADKKTEVSTDTSWTDVSPTAYQAVAKNLGMAIGHKDAGLYDSEAQNVAQPPGFAYIASPSVGSNQYGYWSHNEGGSFWTFLPQYLIMRELFWGNSYRPVMVNEYNGYYNAQRVGRSYYGQETPASPPKYGSHGTFTEQRYSSSRYVQSGGFKSSAYASRPAPSSGPAPSYSPGGQRFGSAPDSSEGHRFGHGSNSPPSGQRFGSGGSRPAPSGRRFGGRRR